MPQLSLKRLSRGVMAAAGWLAVAAAVAVEPWPLPTTSSNEDALRPLSLEATVAELGERVDLLEQENEDLRGAVGQMRQSATANGNRDGEYAIKFNGRIHIDYWAFPGDSPGVNAFDTGDANISPQDRLELRRARFASYGNLPGDTLYKLDFELSEAAEPQFRDLYVGWEDLGVVQRVLFGNQKRPYGLDHLNSSNFNVFMERPFIIQAFNRNNRRFGLLAYGVSEEEAWNWRYGVFNLREIQTDGIYSSDHYQMELAMRLAREIYAPEDASRYIHLATSASYAEPDGNPAPGRARNEARYRTDPEARTDRDWLDTGVIDGASQVYLLGLECVLNSGRFQFCGEYQYRWVDRDPAFGDELYLHGGYFYVAYFLTDNYQPWNRRLGTIGRIASLNDAGDCAFQRCGAWQLAVRWSLADLSDSNVAGGIGESVTFGLNWYWTRRTRLQFNCISGNIWDHAPVDGQTFGSYAILGMRVMADF